MALRTGAAEAGPWTRGPRATAGPLEPPALQEKLSLKALEADIRQQVQLCHFQSQRDLDLLHEQVHTEVHAAVSHELRAVAQTIGQLRGEAMMVLSEKVGPIRGKVAALRQDLTAAERETARLEELCEATQRLQQQREQDAHKAREAAQEAIQESVREAARWTHHAMEAMRSEGLSLEKRLMQQLGAAKHEVDIRLGTLVERASMEQHVEARLADRLSGLAEIGAIGQLVDERVEGLVDRTTLEYCINDAMEEFSRALEAECAERDRFAREQRQVLDELREGLQGSAQVGEARYRDIQAAVAELEARVERARARDARAMELRVDALTQQVAEAQPTDTAEKLQRFADDCRSRLDFAHACWVRHVEWFAEVDCEQLEQQGKFNVESPPFSAACIDDLRLRLRVARTPAALKTWAYGAFLRAPGGAMAFRLHVDDCSQTFSAAFDQSPEMGSQRIAVCERPPKSRVSVRLEILNVSAPLPAAAGWPAALRAGVQVVDTKHAAEQEAEALRASVIRRVEWRISKVGECVAAARGGDEEARGPLCSPPFAAAGLEGLQLRFYPLGYRTQGDDMCGLFLVCPRGVFAKCRAFVGEAVRTFEHTYQDHEPFGRGGFCRLADKIREDGSVLCGVEFLEVRKELTTEVKGGPFGNMTDQVKVVLSPGGGSMDMVREISAARTGKGPSKSRQGPTAEGGGPGIPGPQTVVQPLAVSKSLPALLPAESGREAAVQDLSLGLGASRRQLDL